MESITASMTGVMTAEKVRVPLTKAMASRAFSALILSSKSLYMACSKNGRRRKETPAEMAAARRMGGSQASLPCARW